MIVAVLGNALCKYSIESNISLVQFSVYTFILTTLKVFYLDANANISGRRQKENRYTFNEMLLHAKLLSGRSKY